MQPKKGSALSRATDQEASIASNEAHFYLFFSKWVKCSSNWWRWKTILLHRTSTVLVAHVFSLRPGFVCIHVNAAAVTVASRNAKQSRQIHRWDPPTFPGTILTGNATQACNRPPSLQQPLLILPMQNSAYPPQCIYFKVPLDNLAVELHRVSEFDNRPVRGAPSTAPEWYFQSGLGICVCV